VTQRVLVISQVSVVNGQVSGLAMPIEIVLSPSSTQGIQVIGWQDAISQGYINVNVGSFSGAELTVTLFDQDGNPVPECDAIAMEYQSGTNGNWMAVFGDENFTPQVGSGYTLVVDGTDGAGNTIHLELVAKIEPRQS
jgi:hypothetical protein